MKLLLVLMLAVGTVFACVQNGQDCNAGNECCSGICNGASARAFGTCACIPNEKPCKSSKYCCSGVCLNGKCAACVPSAQFAPTKQAKCCSENKDNLFGGKYSQKCVQDVGEKCATANECDAGSLCQNGKCCRKTGERTHAQSVCCSGKFGKSSAFCG
ncbi:hypothetical protein BC940DRAFT_311088 [Gongronella butleri]|nr:hypothetical protein BC940DRAFT_311088 [Gongronella butleri]